MQVGCVDDVISKKQHVSVTLQALRRLRMPAQHARTHPDPQ